MNTIGEKIAELRKARGMTQEELSSVIGVSPQSVSKWETGTTLPDILLLPVIADVFDVSIDALYGKTISKTTHYPLDEIPDRAFDALLMNMAMGFWPGQEKDDELPEDFIEKQKKFLIENPQSQTAILLDNGGAAYACSALALILRKPASGGTILLGNDKADDLLRTLADQSVRAVMLYQLKNSGVSYTASSAAKKCGLSAEETQQALDKLHRYQFVDVRSVDMDEDQVTVYTMSGNEKLLLVYVILTLAGRLADYHQIYYGFMGSPNWLNGAG
jgi:transcriptional regulator with XRE-family HTH domain